LTEREADFRPKKEAESEPQAASDRATGSKEESSRPAQGESEATPVVKTEVDYSRAEESSEEESASPARRLESRSPSKAVSSKAGSAAEKRSYTPVRPTKGERWKDQQSESESEHPPALREAPGAPPSPPESPGSGRSPSHRSGSEPSELRKSCDRSQFEGYIDSETGIEYRQARSGRFLPVLPTKDRTGPKRSKAGQHKRSARYRSSASQASQPSGKGKPRTLPWKPQDWQGWSTSSSWKSGWSGWNWY
jgi:hypothetical protein